MKQIAILHYASPPGIGGVEVTIGHQAQLLARMGYGVRIISGSGSDFDPNIPSHIDPIFSSSHPDILQVQAELARGIVNETFHELVRRVSKSLHTALEGVDVCIAHNIPTLHKNLALTTALAVYITDNPMRLVAYIHDLAWANTQYQNELHDGKPWDYLRHAWPGVRYATISPMRQAEVAALMGLRPDAIALVTGGIDPAQFLRWTPTTLRLVEKLQLMDADGILLLPARLTRRKNVELALRVLAAMRTQSASDYRLLVTGPPGPHNPSNHAYLTQLLDLRANLGLDVAAHFLYREGPDPQTPLELDNDSISDCYRLADALCFPSTQEGFGLPILEAGLSGIPIFCSDLPPLRQTGGDEAVYFDPLRDSPDHIAAQIITTLHASPTYRLRVRVRQQYRWESIIQNALIPLIEE